MSKWSLVWVLVADTKRIGLEYGAEPEPEAVRTGDAELDGILAAKQAVEGDDFFSGRKAGGGDGCLRL